MAKVWPGNNYPLGAFYDGAGTNFRSSPKSPITWSCAFLTKAAQRQNLICQKLQVFAGMAICLTSDRASVMAFVCTDRGSLRKATAAIRQSCSWTLMRGQLKDKHDGMSRYSLILSLILTVHRTTSTALPSCLNAS